MEAFSTGREYRLLRNVKVPMRDGVQLATTIYLPLAAGRYPSVLMRTAYNRTAVQDDFFPSHGMGLVVQDCRGRYDSEGDFYPFIHEAKDGFDTLDWIGRQPWSNGAVGMFGDSYLAATQFYAATEGSPCLKTLNPRFMTSDCWKRAYYCDGAFSLGLTWSWLCFECNARVSEANFMPAYDVARLLRHLPLLTLDEASGAGIVPYYRDYVRRSAYDAEWKRISIREQFAKFTMPVYLIGGWYDYYAGEAVTTFLGLREHAPTAALRDSHRLLIGPWIHGVNSVTTLGDVDFGPEALKENDATHRWLTCLLSGGNPAEVQRAPIRVFVMGANRWQDEHEWPPARAQATPFYLRQAGALSRRAPAAEAADRYTYDPNDPVPTTGGNHSIGPYNPGLWEIAKSGPYDQRSVEGRQDVLVFTSEVLEREMEVTGNVTLRLYAVSSAPDTDFVGRLTDVYPDGRSINIAEGVLRTRFREDIFGTPRLMEPGRIYPLTIDLGPTSNVFKAGHRIRLHVTSSSFPLWDRNLNTGRDPGTDTDPQCADQMVYHDPDHPSCVMLPVVPAAG